MRADGKNLTALAGGLVIGIVLLEVGLATLGGVHRDFAPAKATFKLSEGRQAVCYEPGSDLEFPLDMRLPQERKMLGDAAEDWRVGHEEKWELEAVFARYPDCISFATGRGSTRQYPQRGETILVLGDSFAFGEGLVPADTLWAQLGKAQARADVVSFASRGADVEELLRQAKAALASSVLDRSKPLRAIYFYNLNDVVDVPPDDSAGPTSSEDYLAAVDDARHLLERWGPSTRLERLLAISRVWWAFRQLEAERWVSERTVTLYSDLYLADSKEVGRARTIVALRTLRDLLKSQNIVLDIVIYPLLAVNEDGSSPFAPLVDVVLDWCRSEGLTCHDGTRAVLDAGPIEDLIVHPRDRHPNGKANQAMARFVVEKVL